MINALLCAVALQTSPSASAAIEGSTVAVSLRGGVVTKLLNKLTKESYVVADVAGAPLAGVYRAGAEPLGVRSGVSTSRTSTGVIERASIAQAAASAAWTGRFDRDPDGQSVAASVSGTTQQGGLYGASWGIGLIPDSCTVFVPGCSGQRFGKDAPYETRTFEYPMMWEAPFVLIQGARGGVIVQSADRRMGQKALTVERVTGGFRLRFESRNEAPFDALRRIDGAPWRIRAYAGNWQVGAALYRDWATRVYGLQPQTKRRPYWAADIRFVAIVGLDLMTIRTLARRVDPRRTLLYVPGWRKDGYDRNYPDYTPAPEFGPFMVEAHRFGFRVMPHVNYFGCDPKHPAYERLRRYQMRDPFTKELLWWTWDLADPPIQFAYISPASREWRALFIDQMKTFCRQYDIDALHLDQTLCIFNDHNGRIDGMNCLEGNIALHKELKDALPDVALSGEGLNEVTCRFESFAQRHVWGMDHTEGTWNETYLRMSHPIASAVLLPSTSIYGYLGMPNPVAAPELYDAWMRAYEHFGVLPTYPWPTLAQLPANANESIERVLRRGGLFMRQALTPDWSRRWTPDELFVWKMRDGGVASYVRDQGIALRFQNAGMAPVVLERRIEGANVFRGLGSIAGWPAYDSSAILGLSPRGRYAWSPAPRDLSAPHIEALPAGWVVERSGRHRGMLRVGLVRAPLASESVRLWERAETARVGVELPNGAARMAPGVAFADDASGGSIHPDGEGLFMHPPWKGLPAPPTVQKPALTFGEWTLALPATPVRFEADATIRLSHQEQARSDGARFRVVVCREADPLRRASGEVVAQPGETSRLTLDLSAFRGSRVVLRLEVDSGPKGDPSFDWGRLIRPSIVPMDTLSRPERVTLRLVGMPGVRTALAANGTAELRRSADGITVEATLPNVLTMTESEPTAATLPLRLADLPLASRSRSETGIEGPPPQYPSAVGPAIVGGQERRAIHEHPPSQGCALLDYHLRLPAKAAKLTGATGIRDGSKSRGVGFRVEVNGRTVFARDAKPGGPWEPFEVDLSEWAGKEVVLTLVTDALGDFGFDWAVWADPTIVAK